MHSFEVLVLAYYLALILTASTSGRPVRGALALAGAAAALVVVAAASDAESWRIWLPHLYLVSGYWIPALMVPTDRRERERSTRFEAWLIRTDAAFRPWLPSLPARAVPVTDLAYLCCYPLVPISFAMVRWQGSSADVERYWLTVLSAGFASYASLPWLLSRPPRIAIGSRPASRGVGALNIFVLDRVSHRWNTFPSGHVAVAAAAAWSVAHVSVAAGTLLGMVAAAVAVGAVAGRHHFIVDVAAGFLAAILAGMIIW